MGPGRAASLQRHVRAGAWDSERRELLLARDQFGIKPLYHARSGGRLAFASEVKGILAHPAFAARIDPRALLEYFTFQNLFTERTLFDGVRLLPAGRCLLQVRDKKVGATERYWDFDFVEPAEVGDPAEYLEELDRLFRQAVTRQLVADVPLGSYLSGGMDSGSVTAVAAPQLENPRTFTVGFDLRSASGIELAFDEQESAEHMSYLFGSEHYEMVLKAGDLERVMPRLTWHLEEPRVGQSYPNFCAAQLASKFVKVVLSGAGGDETFGAIPGGITGPSSTRPSRSTSTSTTPGSALPRTRSWSACSAQLPGRSRASGLGISSATFSPTTLPS